MVIETVSDFSFRSRGHQGALLRWSTLEQVLLSPLQVGKKWFYSELEKMAPVDTLQGYDTFKLRNDMGLKKTKAKMSEVFEAHCVDSWVLANYYVGGHTKPDNTEIMLITPLQFSRRQLHVQNFAKGGIRKQYGGTRSMGLKRGSWVTHPKYGLCFVGGTSKGRVSLHNLSEGKRICQNAKTQDIAFLHFASWRATFPPRPKVRGLSVAAYDMAKKEDGSRTDHPSSNSQASHLRRATQDADE